MVDDYKAVLHRDIVHMSTGPDLVYGLNDDNILCTGYWLLNPKTTLYAKDVTCPHCVDMLNGYEGHQYEIR